MHSSRMRTVRCSGRLGRGVGCLPRGCLPKGVLGVSVEGCLPKGVCLGDVCAGWWGCLPRGCLCKLVGLGVSTQGVCLEGSLPDTPLVNRITDRCDNITFR